MPKRSAASSTPLAAADPPRTASPTAKPTAPPGSSRPSKSRGSEGLRRRQRHVARRKAAQPARKTCGAFGGKTQLGEPCGHIAGYNRPHAKGTGRCFFHDEEAALALSDAKEQFLLLYGTGKVTLAGAAEHACGVDVRTLLRWRRDDPEFDRKVSATTEEIDAIGAIEVEESWVDRLRRGECSAAETFFYLVNRSKGRWKHLAEYTLPKPIGEMTEAELEQLRHGRIPT